MMTQLNSGSSYLIAKIADIDQFIQKTAQIDLSILQPEFTVKEVRQLLRKIVERSFGTHRLLLIPNADRLSSIIQTTLLKVIEEPPSHVVVVVQTTNPDQLLLTIRSRLHTVGARASFLESEASYSVSDLEGATREKAIEILKSIEQTELFSDTVSPTKLSVIASAIQRLTLNCNVKLTIDWFLLRWQVVSGTE